VSGPVQRVDLRRWAWHTPSACRVMPLPRSSV
jgi:hypothetical protein